MSKHWLILVIPVVLLLSACGGSSIGDVQEWMDEEVKNIKPSVPPIPKGVEYRSVAFDMLGRLDPFDTTRFDPEKRHDRKYVAGEAGPCFPCRDERNSILEKYPLETMALIGILHINGQPLVAIKVDNIVQQAKVGEYIGLDFGLITEIKESEVSLKEQVEDADGIWTERTNTLYLQIKEESK
jgi:type IV pilus assembly protein PilP